MILTDRQVVNFWTKVAKPGDKDCWLWGGGVAQDGYGKFGGGVRTYRAHRVSYYLMRGAIPLGMYVCHRCDVPLCVNPQHLFVGTPGDNARDRDSKSRGYFKRGEHNPAAKLAGAEVAEIRRRYHNKEATRVELATVYGVSQPVVSQILLRRKWEHV